MKINKSTLDRKSISLRRKSIALATLLVTASAAQAATYNVYITGPTSFRASANNAIANILTNPVASFSNGASVSVANQATFSGKIGKDTYNILASWTGSEAAVKATAQTTTPLPTLPFLPITTPSSAVTKAVAPAVITGGTLDATPVFENDTPQITLADQWQSSSQFHGTLGGITYATLSGVSLTGFPATGIIAVQPYKVIASARDSAGNSYVPVTYTGNLDTTAGSKTAVLGSAIAGLKLGVVVSNNANIPLDATVTAISGTTLTLSSAATGTGSQVATTFDYAGLGNITNQLARKAFTAANGTLTHLSQFSGSPDDSGILVYPVGRSHDAGTRAGFVLETGIDKPGTGKTAIQQYYPLDADGLVVSKDPAAGTTYTSFELVPAESVNGVQYLLGQSGYSSGGLLAKVFTLTNAVPNTLIIGYLGISDAKTALTGNAQELAFNGVPYSASAVRQGQYSLWNYEHLLFNKSTIPAKSLAVAKLVAAQIGSSDGAVAGILLDANFKASRTPITVDGLGSTVIR